MVGLARIRFLVNVLKLKIKELIMQITTIEGIVENGQIRLMEEVKLPEMTKVYVVIPPDESVKRIMSPRLVIKADSKYFEKIVEVDVDDEV